MSSIGGGMIPPVGYFNPTTPQAATVRCGYVKQVDTVVTDGATPSAIPFTEVSTWNSPDWLSLDGTTWVCITTGIYSITVAQNLTVFNVAEVANPVVSVYATLVSETTTEFNQVLQVSAAIPVTTSQISQQLVLTGIINADAGSVLVVRIVDESGNLLLTSGYSSLPSSAGYLGWSLIAEGSYGQVGTI
jgi:hypothetical protein